MIQKLFEFKYDWDSVKVEDSGAFTESGFDIRLKVYGDNDKELNGYSFFIVPNQMLKSNFNWFNPLVQFSLIKSTDHSIH